MGTRSRQCGPKVPGRFAFPGARNPRICSISRFGKIIPEIFPGLSRGFPREPPQQTPETATAFSSFLTHVPFLACLEFLDSFCRKEFLAFFGRCPLLFPGIFKGSAGKDNPLLGCNTFLGPLLARNCGENAYILGAHWKGCSEEIRRKGGNRRKDVS